MMSVLEKVWEKAERDEGKMLRLLLFIQEVKPDVFMEILKELIHHYAITKEVIE